MQRPLFRRTSPWPLILHAFPACLAPLPGRRGGAKKEGRERRDGDEDGGWREGGVGDGVATSVSPAGSLGSKGGFNFSGGVHPQERRGKGYM